MVPQSWGAPLYLAAGSCELLPLGPVSSSVPWEAWPYKGSEREG